MSVKFWATVPDRIGRVINRAAEHDGSKGASKAGSLLEEIVRAKLLSGEYPEEWGEDLDEELGKKHLKRAISGEELTTEEESLAAEFIGVEVSKLREFTGKA